MGPPYLWLLPDLGERGGDEYEQVGCAQEWILHLRSCTQTKGRGGEPRGPTGPCGGRAQRMLLDLRQ